MLFVTALSRSGNAQSPRSRLMASHLSRQCYLLYMDPALPLPAKAFRTACCTWFSALFKQCSLGLHGLVALENYFFLAAPASSVDDSVKLQSLSLTKANLTSALRRAEPIHFPGLAHHVLSHCFSLNKFPSSTFHSPSLIRLSLPSHITSQSHRPPSGYSTAPQPQQKLP